MQAMLFVLAALAQLMLLPTIVQAHAFETGLCATDHSRSTNDSSTQTCDICTLCVAAEAAPLCPSAPAEAAPRQLVIGSAAPLPIEIRSDRSHYDEHPPTGPPAASV